MKKILLAVTAVFFIAVYVISSSEGMMKVIAQYRYKITSPFGSDKYAYGDLYGLAYLPEYRIDEWHPPAGVVNVNVAKSNRDINLYGLVDSHIWAFLKSDTILYGVKNYWYSTWNDYYGQEKVNIDTHKKNVLLIEIVEHNIRYFADTDYVLNKLLATSNTAPVPQHVANDMGVSRGDELKDAIFHKKINENLEFSLFNYRLFSPLKELKAEMNYKLFGRVDKDVMVSTNRKYLYLKATADTAYESSFYPWPQPKIDAIVNGLNVVYDHYKKVGFDEVCLIMIPNPVTILEPDGPNGHYNGEIPRIQNHPGLKIKVIDLYDTYKNEARDHQIYRYSDTHYSNYAYKLLIEGLNQQLMDVDKRPK